MLSHLFQAWVNGVGIANRNANVGSQLYHYYTGYHAVPPSRVMVGLQWSTGSPASHITPCPKQDGSIPLQTSFEPHQLLHAVSAT